MRSEDSLTGDEDQEELALSEDEGLRPGPPTFMGLSHTALFKCLVYKAKKWPVWQGRQLLFSEPTAEQEVIPSPKLFLDVVQRQWDHPGSIPTLSGTDKRLYNMGPDLMELLQLPSVDGPVATLASSAILPTKIAEGLKAEDRKAEMSFRKTHQVAAWVIRAATEASFFIRTSLIWLHQMQERVPTERYDFTRT